MPQKVRYYLGHFFYGKKRKFTSEIVLPSAANSPDFLVITNSQSHRDEISVVTGFNPSKKNPKKFANLR